MGPFGAGVLTPMVPEIRDNFDVSTGAVAWGFTVYLLPFAAFLLVSGTLGESWGVNRTLRLAFALYAPVTLACALAPTFAVFLAARAGQGVLNAFMTPLLLAALADGIDARRLGRVIGAYAAFQALGQLLAPFVGGVAADVDWRWAFAAVTATSLMVSVGVPPAGSAGAGVARSRSDTDASLNLSGALRALLARPTLLLGATALLAAAGPLGAAVLVGVTARDTFGLTGGQAGLLLLVGAAAAMVLVQPWGRVVDSWGGCRAMVASLLASGVVVAAIAGVNTVWLLVVLWAGAGAATQFVVVGFQSLAATSGNTNRAGVMSFTLSHRFFGHSLGAVVWLPVLEASSTVAYVGSASIALLAVAAVLASGLGRR